MQRSPRTSLCSSESCVKRLSEDRCPILLAANVKFKRCVFRRNVVEKRGENPRFALHFATQGNVEVETGDADIFKNFCGQVFEMTKSCKGYYLASEQVMLSLPVTIGDQSYADDFNPQSFDKPSHLEGALAFFRSACDRLLMDCRDQCGMKTLPADPDSGEVPLVFELGIETMASASAEDSHMFTQEIVENINRYIDENCCNRINLNDLSTIAKSTYNSFAKRFRRTTGLAPYQYVLRRRLLNASDLLRNSDRTIAQIAFSCGFSSQAHMTTLFKKYLHTTPGRVRKAPSSHPNPQSIQNFRYE